jgi:hypothetical protein
MPMFRNTVCSIFTGRWACVDSTHAYLPVKMEQTECSETSAYKLQTPGNYQKKAYKEEEDDEKQEETEEGTSQK